MLSIFVGFWFSVALVLALPATPKVIHLTPGQESSSPSTTRIAPESVWVNHSSGVYHCPGTRYYGGTKRGEFMSETEALNAGNRPAYGRSCGESTLRAMKVGSALPIKRPASRVTFQDSSKGATRVWVNRASRVYHCPGTRYYGATKRGEFMTEKEAVRTGNRPAYGRVCN